MGAERSAKKESELDARSPKLLFPSSAGLRRALATPSPDRPDVPDPAGRHMKRQVLFTTQLLALRKPVEYLRIIIIMACRKNYGADG